MREDGTKEIAPVYDNGNCLNSKWDDVKMKMVLEDEKKLEAETYKARRCIYELHGKKINPYQLIEGMMYRECCKAVMRLTPRIGGCISQIYKMIENIPVLSEVQKQFYCIIIKERYEKVFIPVYQKLM